VLGGPFFFKPENKPDAKGLEEEHPEKKQA
jgi:hypothetical protein